MKSGILTAAIGSSRSGKTQYVTSRTKSAKRVLIWDIKGEYVGVNRARNRAGLLSMIKGALGKPCKIAYTPDSIGDFSFFCQCAQTWVKSQYKAGFQSVLIFEETADVTSPAKAPDEYGIILRRYLSYGVDIYAITQRPAESDKTAVGNASILRICRLQLDRDRKSASSDTGLPLVVIDNLGADQEAGKFDYITADTGRRKWRSGQLTFSGGKPVFTDSKNENPL